MRAKSFAYPYVLWMALFVVAPIVIIVIYAFTTADGGFTFENFASMGGTYLSVFGRSFLLAIIATAICLLIGYPVAYSLAREKSRLQGIIVMLIMLPMWMNFLLRTYSWMSILENTGLLNRFFSAIGLFDLINAISGFINETFGTNLSTDLEYFEMINTQGAVVLGMVYNYLPFMILPIYSVILKIDSSYLEAARDLGAPPRTVFRKVVFPLSLSGVLSGITMVFVPAVSTFVISDLLGGAKIMLLGNLIQMQFLGSTYNPHLGSAIALIMMVVVIICMTVMNKFGDEEEQAVMF